MSDRQREAVERAHGKVNLGLAVMARRGDGYHQIETLMARLALADRVTVRLVEPGAAAPGSVVLRVELDEELKARSVAGGGLPQVADDNLVVRAARAYLAAWSEVTGASPPAVELELEKRLPIAAGLGGGSSDAAATLRALQRVLPAGATARSGPDAAAAMDEGIDIVALAATLGSDVPFFAADLAAALARGRGERLDPLNLPPAWLVLAKPPLAVSAAEAYAELVGFSPRLKVPALLAALAADEPPAWRNALQAGVMRSRPVVREVIGLLRQAGLRSPLMSGSGPTCFALAADEDQALSTAQDLKTANPQLWVAASRLA